MDLVKGLVEGDSAVLAHDALTAGVEEWIDFVGFLDMAQGVGATGEALVGAHARGAVGAEVIDGFDPAGEGCVEFGKGMDALAFEAQGGLEVALDGADEPLDLALAPGVIGFGVKQADAEVGANGAGVVADKGLALVGIELVGQAAAQDGLLEAVEESDGVAGEIIGGVGDEAAVVVNNDAELGGDGFALGSAQGGAAGEVDHPEVVGIRGLEGFLRAAVESSGTQGAAIVAVGFEEAVNGADGWQVVAVLLPVAVEDLQRGVGVLLDFHEDPFTGFLVDGAAFAGVGTGVLAGEAGVAAFGVVIPPGFQGTAGVVVAIGLGPWARGGAPQALGERNPLLVEVLEVADDLEA